MGIGYTHRSTSVSATSSKSPSSKVVTRSLATALQKTARNKPFFYLLVVLNDT